MVLMDSDVCAANSIFTLEFIYIHFFILNSFYANKGFLAIGAKARLSQNPDVQI